jgi:hypothetical protein
MGLWCVDMSWAFQLAVSVIRRCLEITDVLSVSLVINILVRLSKRMCVSEMDYYCKVMNVVIFLRLTAVVIVA